MLRGEFIRGDGRILPNNITSRGAQRILSRAFSQLDGTTVVDPSLEINYIALGKGVYTPTVAFADLGEPTVGVGGYAREVIPFGATGWTQAQLNGEWYVESKQFGFAVTSAYDKPVNRLILTGASGADVNSVGTPWAVSSPFDELTIDASTPDILRTFKYRLYLR
jgi:hypothetical protein